MRTEEEKAYKAVLQAEYNRLKTEITDMSEEKKEQERQEKQGKEFVKQD